MSEEFEIQSQHNPNHCDYNQDNIDDLLQSLEKEPEHQKSGSDKTVEK
jgi:hypothetical protein